MKRFLQIILFIYISTITVFADSWNLVWKQDFGVVEDSVVADIPNTEIRSILNYSDNYWGQCVYFDNGYYGLVNSPWWTFNQKGGCTSGKCVFTSGRDHTGNPNGAMFLLNIASDSKGLTLYQQALDFKKCEGTAENTVRKYKFVIYAASVSTGTNPNLILEVTNANDPNNQIILGSVKTGAIPHWEANDDNAESIHATKTWYEYSIEFEAADEDALMMKVISNCNNGLGNDFAMDDLTLYRLDSDSIPEPQVGIDKITDFDGLSCSSKIRYQVTNDILAELEPSFQHVYFSWQKSTDNGLTWTVMDEVSGEKKLSMITDVASNPTDIIYRLVITGSNSSLADAKTEAKNIAQNGVPSSNCVAFSYSNTLTSLQDEEVELPKAHIGIDGDEDTKSLLGIDCTTPHSVDLFAGKWDDQYSSRYYFAWQSSKDLVTWEKTTAQGKSIPGGNTGDTIYYRAVLSSSQSVVDAFLDGQLVSCDDAYLLTDTVVIGCITCEKPEFNVNNTLLTICSDDTKPLSWEVTQTNTAPVDEMKWFSKGLHETSWKQISGEDATTYSFTNPGDSTRYLFLANSGTCLSDSIIFQLNVIQTPVLAPSKDTVVCKGATFDLKCPCIQGEATLYDWNGIPSSSATYGLADIDHDYTFQITAMNDICISEERTINVKVQEPIQITMEEIPSTLCINDEFTFNANISSGSADSCHWFVDGVEVFAGSNIFTYTPTKKAKYQLVVNDSICPSVSSPEYELDVTFDVKVTLEAATPVVCEGDGPRFNPKSNIPSTMKGNLVWERSMDGINFDQNLVITDSCPYIYYRIKERVDNRCQWSYSDIVPIKVERRNKGLIKTAPTTICQGDNILLEAEVESNEFTDYAWYKNGKEISPNSLTLTDTPDGNTTYEFVVKGDACPTSSSKITVEVGDNSVPTIKEHPSSICEGGSVSLEAITGTNPNNSYAWVKNGTDTISKGSTTMTDTPTKESTYQFIVSGGNCPSKSEEVTIALAQAEKLVINPPTILSDSYTVFLEVSGTIDPNSSYAWVKNGTDTISRGETTLTDTPTETSTYRFVITDGICPSQSNAVLIEVDYEDPTSSHDTLVVCDGATITFDATTLLASNNTIIWLRNGSDTIAKGVTHFTYQPTESSNYQFFVLGDNHIRMSNIEYVKVIPNEQPIIKDVPSIICEGNTITLEADALVDPKWSYAWVRNGTDTLSRSSLTLTDTPTGKTTYQFVRGEKCPNKSEIVTIDVTPNEKPIIKEAPTTICEGNSVTLEADASVDPNGFYGWVKNGTDTLSKGELTLTVSPTEETSYQFVKGGSCPNKSDVMTIEVTPNEKPILKETPTTICEGNSVTLEADASVDPNGFYGWVKNGTDTLNKGELTLTVSPTEQTSYQFVKGGSCPNESDVVTIDVTPNEKPILKQPTVRGDGKTVVLDVESDIDPNSSYAWVKNGTDTIAKGQLQITDRPTEKSTYEFVVTGGICPSKSDAITVELTPDTFLILGESLTICEGDSAPIEAHITNLLPEDKIYWIENSKDTIAENVFDLNLHPKVTSSYQFVVIANGTLKVRSNVFIIKVIPNGQPTITAFPSNVCEGSIISLTAEANGETNGVFGWEKNESEIVGIQQLTLTDTLTEKTTYRFIRGGQCPNMSEIVTIDVTPNVKPVIKEAPATICEGNSVTLEAEANVNPNGVYGWVKNGTDTLSKGELTLNVSPTEETSYQFVVGGNCPNESDVVTIDVIPTVKPVIKEAPATICEGNSVTLEAEANVNPNGVYGWVKNGTDTLSKGELTLNVSPTEETSYQFVVGGNCPNESDVVTIDVIPTVKPVIKEAPTSVSKGTDITLEVDATIDPNLSFAWVKNGTDTLSQGEKILTDTPDRSSTYEFVIEGACPSKSEAVTIYVVSDEKPVIKEVPAYLCEGSFIMLEATAEYDENSTIAWIKNGTDTISKGSLRVMEFPTEKSSYQFVIIDNNMTRSSETITVDVISYSIPTIKEVPTLICEGTSVILEAEAAGMPNNDYVWVKNSIDTLARGVLQMTDIPTEESTYQFVIEGNCPNHSEMVTIEVAKQTELEIATEDSVICLGDDADITFVTQKEIRSGVSPIAEILWADEMDYKKQEELGIVTSDFTLTDISKSFFLRLAIREDVCPDALSNVVRVKVDTPNKDIKVDSANICEGETATLRVRGITQRTDITWVSAEGDTLSDKETEITVSPQGTTDYRVIVENGVCQDEADATVVVHTKPTILSFDPISYDTYQVKAEATSHPLTYYYEGKESASDTLSHLLMGMTYHVEVKDAEGCIDTLSFTVPTYGIEIPEYFVADKETWKIQNIDLFEQSSYKIYDRWGKLLFEGEATDDGWDGVYNGHDMPSTDYWYTINIPEIRRVFKGHFTLIRSGK